MKMSETVISGALKQQQKAKDEAAGADVRHNEIEDTRAARFFLLVFETDEAVCRESHDFPGDQEEKGVVSEKHQCRRQEQSVKECAENADILSSKVGAGVAE